MRTVLASWAGVFAALLMAGCGARLPNVRYQLEARQISPDEVAYVELKGQHLSLDRVPPFGDAVGEPQRVTDRAGIAAWLSALRVSSRDRTYDESFVTTDVGAGYDQVSVVAKPGKESKGFSLYIDSGDLRRKYGPEVEKVFSRYRNR